MESQTQTYITKQVTVSQMLDAVSRVRKNYDKRLTGEIGLVGSDPVKAAHVDSKSTAMYEIFWALHDELSNILNS